MLSAASICLGYATLVLSFGWRGVAASVVHITLMLFASLPRD